ncbi:hypothetical protein [Agathobaculum sp.]|uniref:hypothetical protein n=1 Tax=Agathobaculum sp. TaxID=2048138 RepID=UPI002A833629|nr:hypothetical protein [Agathobaculum sp.]MDY3617972.1 hypothetical protein [Agathobaculum sp.]
MFCRGQAFGLALICLGVGVLVGSILPSIWFKWLLSFALIAAGVFLASVRW